MKPQSGVRNVILSTQWQVQLRRLDVTKAKKMYDCLVSETGEFRQFYYRSDAERFIHSQNALGYHVLRGVSYIQSYDWI